MLNEQTVSRWRLVRKLVLRERSVSIEKVNIIFELLRVDIEVEEIIRTSGTRNMYKRKYEQ